MLDRPQVCARAGLDCSGRMTIEHAFGRKMEASWNCIWLCWFHHLGAGLSKELNRHLAYQNITNEELKKYKLGEQMIVEKKFLKQKYDRNPTTH